MPSFQASQGQRKRAQRKTDNFVMDSKRKVPWLYLTATMYGEWGSIVLKSFAWGKCTASRARINLVDLDPQTQTKSYWEGERGHGCRGGNDYLIASY